MLHIKYIYYILTVELESIDNLQLYYTLCITHVLFFLIHSKITNYKN